MKRCEMIGTIEMFVTKPDGTKELVQRVRNTIAATFLARVATNLINDRDIQMNNMFIANVQPPVDGQDGISFIDNDSGLTYSMITTKTHPTATTVVVQGTFTGTAVKVSSLTMGLGWLNLGTIHGFFSTIGEGGVAIASSAGTSWVVASFGAGDTVTINWTFEVV